MMQVLSLIRLLTHKKGSIFVRLLNYSHKIVRCLKNGLGRWPVLISDPSRLILLLISIGGWLSNALDINLGFISMELCDPIGMGVQC